METETPQFEHDSDCCTFLGRFTMEAGERGWPTDYDLYHCMQGGRPTVSARYSSDGPDYFSGMIFGENGQIPALVEARNRAIERGLDVTAWWSAPNQTV